MLLNASVGFWQEHKAENAIELLKKKLALKARALRDGKWQEIPARELVPGDVVRVRLRDIVPADIKLMKGEYLLVDQSALTGESLPVEKHTSDVGYSGSPKLGLLSVLATIQRIKTDQSLCWQEAITNYVLSEFGKREVDGSCL